MRPAIQISVVLLVAGAAFAIVPGAWEQRPLAKQADDDEAHNGVPYIDLPFSMTELEAYIQDVMERWHAPGVAVAIIKGENTWAKVGFHGPKVTDCVGQLASTLRMELKGFTEMLTTNSRASATHRLIHQRL